MSTGKQPSAGGGKKAGRGKKAVGGKKAAAAPKKKPSSFGEWWKRLVRRDSKYRIRF